MEHSPIQSLCGLAHRRTVGGPSTWDGAQVRTDAVPALDKQYFSGGTVALASASSDFYVLKCNPSERLEDGTVAFLDIAAVPYGLEFMESLGGAWGGPWDPWRARGRPRRGA